MTLIGATCCVPTVARLAFLVVRQVDVVKVLAYIGRLHGARAEHDLILVELVRPVPMWLGGTALVGLFALPPNEQ